MRSTLLRLAVGLGFCGLLGVAALAAPDAATKAELIKEQTGASDFQPAGRYDGANILAQTVKAFDELNLPAGPTVSDATNPKTHFKSVVTARGRVTRSLYVAPEGRSTLEILLNHETALKQAGYTVAFECAGTACGEDFGKLTYSSDNPDTRIVVDKAGQIRSYLTDAMLEYVKDVRYALLKKTTPAGDSYVGVYVAVMTGGSRGDFSDAVSGHEGILVEAVEPKPIEQKIVTVTASEIQTKIAADGRAVFYGIYFDFNKADLKPESDPQLAEMANYLTKNPAAKMFVVGHTDNVGGLDYNMALSQKRAQAVVAALTGKYKIAAARLVARGVGPLSPIAENRDDAGRAKNRRVEMVEMAN